MKFVFCELKRFFLGMPGPRGRSGKPGNHGTPGIPGITAWKTRVNGSSELLIAPSIAGSFLLFSPKKKSFRMRNVHLGIVPAGKRGPKEVHGRGKFNKVDFYIVVTHSSLHNKARITKTELANCIFKVINVFCYVHFALHEITYLFFSFLEPSFGRVML